MQPATPRQREILALARVQGRVSVDGLAEKFSLTPQTIRKDLNDLCGRRLLSRIHGGAVITSGIENIAYEARRLIAADEKRAIGLAAAALIADGSSLFINIGTTTEEVAQALTSHKDLLVITNNLNVARMLYPCTGFDVVVAGGPVRRSDGAVIGTAAVDFIRQFKVDSAVIGASAIDEDCALLDFDYREVLVSQAIIENARRVILVADRLKFSRSAPVRIGHISQVQTFVTDHLPSHRLRSICSQHSVKVIETVPMNGDVSATIA